jgi:serine protease inhibitor
MRSRIAALISLPAFTFMTASGSASEAMPAKMSALVSGNNAFALSLYAQLEAGDENLFFSPASISAALAMTYAGARGDTATQMAQVLHFQRSTVHSEFEALLNGLVARGKDNGEVLTIANALWGQQSYPFRPEFVDLVTRNYHAGHESLDFIDHPEQARLTINAWVEKETRNKIVDMLAPGVITPDTRLVLTNAVYFKGAWSYAFRKEATRDEPFWRHGREASSVPLMHQKHSYRYAEAPGVQILELPYRKHLSLVVVLPRERAGLSDVEKSLSTELHGEGQDLTAARRMQDIFKRYSAMQAGGAPGGGRIDQWLGQMKMTAVDLWLPRFKVTAAMNLNDRLSQLGMPLAFSDNADFSGISNKEGLKISDVVHKAYVDINEEGTEAAASTAVMITPTMARINPHPPVVFRADHPFLFMIRDPDTGSILFLGRLTEPKP